MGYRWLFLVLLLTISNEMVAQNLWIKNLVDIPAPIYVDGYRLHQPEWVSRLYQTHQYQVLWTNPADQELLFDHLRKAMEWGYSASDFHLEQISPQKKVYPTPLDTALRDILLTDALLHYFRRENSGIVPTHELGANSYPRRSPISYPGDSVATAIARGQLSVFLASVHSANSLYGRLAGLLPRYKRLSLLGGWPLVPDGSNAQEGEDSLRVIALRKRLFIEGYYTNSLTLENSHFDSLLLQAVQGFQSSRGLVADGVVGKKTLEAMNEPIDAVITKMLINMERMRWVAKAPDQHLVRVNIPDFSLEVWEVDSLVMRMRAIVGRPARKTPMLTSEIKFITLNPTWTVPPTILREDLLPAVKRDVTYLKRQNLRILNASGEEVDPTSLDWTTLTAQNFPYTVRQDAGSYNSLGLIKFSFPNDYTVFLHDTNHRALFREANRALSSGCVRIERPFALAEFLLGDTQRLKRVMQAGSTETILLKVPVSVHLAYYTAFANDQGELQLRPDIYGWDKELVRVWFQTTGR